PNLETTPGGCHRGFTLKAVFSRCTAARRHAEHMAFATALPWLAGQLATPDVVRIPLPSKFSGQAL
ncbi:hypothetical protein, partial [Mycobacterium intracellulare]|uniref:hypothetical protein n=1 Tax=Mycobacterium intracellulare TaxID=1767 RepID=UPI001F47EF9D